MTDSIRILIADDHKMVREGLKTFMRPIADFEIIGEACNGREAVEQAEKLNPDVVLLDLIMPEMDGIAAAQLLRQRDPNARILMITSFAEDEKVVAAIKAGALGYLEDLSPQDLEAAIRDVYRGESYLPGQIARKVIRELNKPAEKQVASDALTPREVEILQLVADGLSNDEIAQKLVLSAWTVRSHLGRIMKKLQVENRTQAAMSALRSGIVKMNQA